MQREKKTVARQSLYRKYKVYRRHKIIREEGKLPRDCSPRKGNRELNIYP
jgi:hypothetical protein